MLAKIKAALRAVSTFVRDEQPVAVLHAISAVAAVVAAAKTGHVDYGLVVAAWLAVQGVWLRRKVTPTAKIPPVA